MSEVVTEVRGKAGLITLNRPKALNALSLAMIRDLSAALRAFERDGRVELVAVRGQGREGPFGAFCAGGDIRFFHRAALADDSQLEDFFTEEYTLNHQVHHFPKPYAVFLDGIVMGGGMGISGHGRSGATMRVATERTKMAMPETNIGLFPDVGGGYFLPRCPGRIGEYLALTGLPITGADALAVGLADVLVDSGQLSLLWDSLEQGTAALRNISGATAPSELQGRQGAIARFFGLPSVSQIVMALEADGTAWARETAQLLRKRSPLMLNVALEQLRRGRAMGLADELRMERGMVRHCFHLRPGAAGETVEGIRAFAIDKDHRPKWNPERIEDVMPAMVEAFFDSPWPASAHPLRDLA